MIEEPDYIISGTKVKPTLRYSHYAFIQEATVKKNQNTMLKDRRGYSHKIENPPQYVHLLIKDKTHKRGLIQKLFGISLLGRVGRELEKIAKHEMEILGIEEDVPLENKILLTEVSSLQATTPSL